MEQLGVPARQSANPSVSQSLGGAGADIILRRSLGGADIVRRSLGGADIVLRRSLGGADFVRCCANHVTVRKR